MMLNTMSRNKNEKKHEKNETKQKTLCRTSTNNKRMRTSIVSLSDRNAHPPWKIKFYQIWARVFKTNPLLVQQRMG